jgi:general stress protein 26
MSQPQPQPIDLAELSALAQRTMKAAKFPMLATMEGIQPRLRPVSPVRTEGFTVYVANLRRYGKTAQIASNPKVELCYCDDGHDQVRITAVAEVLADRAMLEAIWSANPLLRAYLGSVDKPRTHHLPPSPNAGSLHA